MGWAPGPVWTGAENLAPTGIRSPDRPARSQSLYRLRYPAHASHYYSYYIIIIIIIIFIIIRHQLGLERPLSTSPKMFSNFFKVAFVHSVHGSAIFFPSCSCSFLLHVVANLICIFSISRQLVLLSTLPKFLHSRPNVDVLSFIKLQIS